MAFQLLKLLVLPPPAGPGAQGCMPAPANATNNTYCLNTNLTGVSDSEAYCNTLGGHLVSWNSQAEQAEVEGYWLKAGLLLPLFHKAYWTGAYIGDEDVWPNFMWLVGGMHGRCTCAAELQPTQPTAGCELLPAGSVAFCAPPAPAGPHPWHQFELLHALGHPSWPAQGAQPGRCHGSGGQCSSRVPEPLGLGGHGQCLARRGDVRDPTWVPLHAAAAVQRS